MKSHNVNLFNGSSFTDRFHYSDLPVRNPYINDSQCYRVQICLHPTGFKPYGYK